VENSDDEDDDFYDRTGKDYYHPSPFTTLLVQCKAIVIRTPFGQLFSNLPPTLLFFPFVSPTVKKKTGSKKTEQKADTHESLQEKHALLLKDMASLEIQIQEYDAEAATRKQLEESGDLDAYMASLEKSAGRDSKPKMRQNLAAMKKEEKRLLMLIEYTKPVDIMAKIGTGTGASTGAATTSQPKKAETVTTAKRQNKADTMASPSTEVKKPRVLGPSLPPPS